ncbi:MAG TPA: hypothetical protein VI457_14890, partial [Methylococcaceae bacterium]|nr:hypothetical protein [Methylococcaceae bacterium]
GEAANLASVAEALAGGDAQRLADEEARITRTLPGAWSVRLVLPSIAQVDEARDPPFGFADLELVKDAVGADPHPALHQPGSPKARLVVARRVRSGEQVVGVLWASYAAKNLDELRLAAGDGVALELRQDSAGLLFSGDSARKNDTPDGAAPVVGTDWKVAYWSAPPAAVGWLYPLAVAFGGVLMAGLYVAVHRWTLRALAHDEDSLYRLVKDIMVGKVQGSYPVRLNDLQSLIVRITQFRNPAPEPPAAPTGKADFSKHLIMEDIDLDNPGGAADRGLDR